MQIAALARFIVHANTALMMMFADDAIACVTRSKSATTKTHRDGNQEKLSACVRKHL
jgi:hypothetical protein